MLCKQGRIKDRQCMGRQNQFSGSGYNNIFRGLHLRRFFAHILGKINENLIRK